MQLFFSSWLLPHQRGLIATAYRHYLLLSTVIPAKAGNQCFFFWIPAFAGMTRFTKNISGTVKLCGFPGNAGVYLMKISIPNPHG